MENIMDYDKDELVFAYKQIKAQECKLKRELRKLHLPNGLLPQPTYTPVEVPEKPKRKRERSGSVKPKRVIEEVGENISLLTDAELIAKVELYQAEITKRLKAR